MDSETYKFMLTDSSLGANYFDYEINGIFRKYLGDGFNNSLKVESRRDICYIKNETVSFKLPIDVAEKIDTNDGAFVMNITMGVKGENIPEGIECYIKEINIDVVEKNELYSAKALSQRASAWPLWRDIHKLMKNKDDITAVLAQVNDKRVIYSTNDVTILENKIR